MISWLWRLGLIALLTWAAVPLLMREDTPATTPDTLGAEVVDSALGAWQRFWAERSPAATNPTATPSFSVGSLPKALESWLGEQQGDGNAMLQALSLLPQGHSLNVAQLQQRAQAMGISLDEDDAEQLLAWLETQRP